MEIAGFVAAIIAATVSIVTLVLVIASWVYGYGKLVARVDNMDKQMERLADNYEKVSAEQANIRRDMWDIGRDLRQDIQELQRRSRGGS